MEKPNQCPICKGDIEIKDGTIDQSDKPIAAEVKICIGGRDSGYGCGFKSWRRKTDF